MRETSCSRPRLPQSNDILDLHSVRRAFGYLSTCHDIELMTTSILRDAEMSKKKRGVENRNIRAEGLLIQLGFGRWSGRASMAEPVPDPRPLVKNRMT